MINNNLINCINFLKERLYCTVGCHPTRCGEFLVDTYYFEKLCTQIEEHRSKVIAIGEIGLDYDRLHFCEPDVQKQLSTMIFIPVGLLK